MAANRLGARAEIALAAGAVEARCPAPDAWSAARFLALAFGGSGSAAPDLLPVPLRRLGGATSWRIWEGPEPTRRAAGDALEALLTPEHLVLHASLPLAPGADIAEAARRAYGALLGRVGALGYPHLVRIWNFVPAINDGVGDQETYVRFNAGRHAAFEALGFGPGLYPAATGVGSPPGSPLTVVVAASRTAPLAVENPRQTSAYRYPRRYGPRAPAFARATVLPDRDGATLFVSGTASIVGHESRGAGIDAQLAETLANLAEIRARAARTLPGLVPGPRARWQVYLRDPAHLERVAAVIDGALGPPGSVAYLAAEICRRELLVEIEGTCELLAAPAER